MKKADRIRFVLNNIDSVSKRKECTEQLEALLNYTISGESTGEFVILHFFPNEPAQVYGSFDSEEEAREYAERQGFAVSPGAYAVHEVLNAHLTYQWRREAWE